MSLSVSQLWLPLLTNNTRYVIRKKAFSHRYVLPNMLAMESAKSRRAGNRVAGTSFQNEIAGSLRFV